MTEYVDLVVWLAANSADSPEVWRQRLVDGQVTLNGQSFFAGLELEEYRLRRDQLGNVEFDGERVLRN